MTSFGFGFSARTHRSVIHNCKTSGDRVSHPMSILTSNLLRRNPRLCAELFKNLLKRWVTFINSRICCKLNLLYSSAKF